MAVASGKSLATTFYLSTSPESPKAIRHHQLAVPSLSHIQQISDSLFILPPTPVLQPNLPLVPSVPWSSRHDNSELSLIFKLHHLLSSFFSSIPTAWRLGHSLLLSLHFWSLPFTPPNIKPMFQEHAISYSKKRLVKESYFCMIPDCHHSSHLIP